MSWFGGKKKHYVDTTVTQVVDPNLLPNIMTTAIVESIFGEAGITESILTEALYGNFRNFERGYKFAAGTDDNGQPNYTYGLPNATAMSNSDGYEQAAAALKSDVGEATIDYMHYRPLNNFHAGYQWMTENWDYNFETNRIGALSDYIGRDVYVEKMTAYHDTAPGQEPEIIAIGSFDRSPESGYTPIREDLTIQDLFIEQEVYIREGPEQVVIHWLSVIEADSSAEPPIEREETRGTHTVDLTPFDNDSEFYQARWRQGNTTGFWTYNPNENRHPALDAVFELGYIDPGTYFPFIIFREEGSNYAESASPEDLAGLVRLCDIMGFDYLEMSESIHSNEDIDDIRQAVMMMAVPITTQDEIQIEYLWEHFSDLQEKLFLGAEYRPPFSSLKDLYGGSEDSYALNVRDSDFNMTISFDGLERNLRSGNLGAGIEFTNTEEVDEQITASIPGLYGAGLSFPANNRYIRKQIMPGVYEEIKIKNPRFRMPIFLDGRKAAEGGGFDDRLLIPMDYQIAKELSLIKREQLYYMSLNLIFNSHVVEKTKWYQSTGFQVILFVVAVALAWWSGGQSLSGFFAAIAAGGAGATAAIMALATLIIKSLVLSMAVKIVFKEIVELIGPELAMVLAVVALVYGGYQGYTTEGSMLENATTQNMLMAANGLMGGTQDYYATETQDLLEELDKFNTMKELKLDEMAKLEDELEGAINVNPMTFVGLQPFSIPGEAPNTYFQRTVHSGNVGIQTLEIIENYVDFSLTLPSIEESIGRLDNGGSTPFYL